MSGKNQALSGTQKRKDPTLSQCLHIFDGIDMPWLLLLGALLFTVFSAWAGLTTVTFSGTVIDATGNVPGDKLWSYILMTLLAVAFTIGSGIFSNYAKARIQHLLRNKLWHKIMVTRQSDYDVDGGESMVGRVTSDCNFAADFFTALFNLVTLLINSTMYLVQMWLLNRKITTWVLIFIPIAFVLGLSYFVLQFVVAKATQEKLSASTSYLAERTKDLNLIKACNAQRMELQKGRELFKNQANLYIKSAAVQLIQETSANAMNTIGRILPFVLGAALVGSGELTLGTLVIINTLFGNVTGVFGNLITYIGDVKKAHGALARVSNFFAQEEEDLYAGEELESAKDKTLALQGVEFSYTADRNILKNLSCRFPAGKITAVVGTNGSGKTTVFKLLDRLYEPDSGNIILEGVDAKKYSVASWRSRVCLIAQGAPMMEGTIRSNICYGVTEAVSEEELLRVARLSHVYDFVKDLPDGFDSRVAPGGTNFSGGQKQCIAIARAMMSKADVLMLDESTSNLDAKKEKDVLEAMGELMKGRTTLVIAHSLAAIKNADHVVVINNGCMESEGSPKEIIAQTDNYLKKLENRWAPFQEIIA